MDTHRRMNESPVRLVTVAQEEREVKEYVGNNWKEGDRSKMGDICLP